MSDIKITELPQLGHDYADAILASGGKDSECIDKVCPDATEEEKRIICEYTQWMIWASLRARNQ